MTSGTTSGTSSFNYNRDQIIASAARKIGAIAAGETLSSGAVQDFADQLNIMVKGWDASGLHIWTEEEATLFTQPNQFSYTIGGTTTDNAALTSYTATTLQNSALAGATSVSVVSATGFTAAFFVGIVLNSGSIFWTTQSGAASGSSIPLTAPLSGAANGGNAVYTYQTQITRPLRVVSGRRFAFNGQLDTQMTAYSRIDYRNQPNKTANGTITQYFYDPRGGANNQGMIWLWPNPPDVTSAFKFTWWRAIQDFDTPGNIADLPVEWIDPLVWNLAAEMAIEYDCPPQRLQMIQQQAASTLERVAGWDREPESYLFGFDTDQTGP